MPVEIDDRMAFDAESVSDVVQGGHDELRRGLTFSSSHQFRDCAASASTLFSQTEIGQSFDLIQNLSISKTSSKRKRPEDERGSHKRS